MLLDVDRAERDRKGGPVMTRTDWTAEPGPRQWLVDGWLPAGRVALLSGQGGAGKSRLALQLAAGPGGEAAQGLATGRRPGSLVDIRPGGGGDVGRRTGRNSPAAAEHG